MAPSASDADFAVYEKLKKAFEPIREKHTVIDTSGDWEKQVGILIKNQKIT